MKPLAAIPVLLALLAPAVSAQDVAAVRAPDIASIVEVARDRLAAIHRERGFPGATIAFELPDGRAGAAAVGLADVEAERAMRTSDRMMSGSVGKMLFAVTILRAVEAGELELDEPISRWLGERPWFARLPNAEQLTLRILLRHRSGIPEHVQRRDFWEACRADPDRCWAPEELVAYVLDDPPLFAADESFAYADTNYIVAGIVYESATDRRIYDDVRRIVLEPLGMRDTVPSDRRKIPGLITGYGAPDSPFELRGRVLDADGVFVIQPQLEWTGGGFAWTTRDLARFGQALFTGDALLPAPRRAEMLDARPAGRLGAYGLGVIVGESPLGPTFGHSGFFPGYLCQLSHYPDARMTVALSVNTDEFRKVGALQRIVDDVAVAISDALRDRP